MNKKMTQTRRILRAVSRGATDAKTIAKKARVPLPHVHPILNRLRKKGYVRGFTGKLRVTRQGKDKL